MNSDDIISQSFGVIINPMRFLGLYPPDKPSTLYTLRSFCLYIVLMVIVVILIFVKLVSEKNADLLDLNYMCVYVAEIGFAALKLLPFFTNAKKVKKCIHYFGQERFAPKNKEEEKMTDICIRVCQVSCKVYFYGIIVVAVLWLLPIWVSRERQLPMDIWLPFDPFSNTLVFYTTLIFLSIATLYDGVSSTLVDPMIGTLSFHATTQLKILKYNLQTLDKLIKDKSIFSPNEFSVLRFDDAFDILKRCIDHHNDILEFVKEFENCFSWFIFYQVAGSTLSLCFCCIGFTLASLASIDAARYFTFYTLLMFQIFFYFLFGTLLHEENNSFMQAICESPWYKYDPEIRKVLIVMMERSKQPMMITAGKVVNLTLATFTKILRTSYSLVAVLKSFQ